MVSKKLYPTALQAQAVWLRSLGLPFPDIATQLEISAESARVAWVAGRRKILAAGLPLPAVRRDAYEPRGTVSKMDLMVALAKEAGLK
jgi:hypothetical protein